MGQQIIRMNGFEEELAQYIATNFRFIDDDLSDLVLVLGRHLWVQDMPEVEDLIRDFEESDEPYVPEEEPCIAIYTEGTPVIEPTVSSGSKHEWNLRVVLRMGTVSETAKILLENLTDFFLIRCRGKQTGLFVIKGSQVISRPSVFARAGDDHIYCSVLLRFLVVPVPT